MEEEAKHAEKSNGAGKSRKGLRRTLLKKGASLTNLSSLKKKLASATSKGTLLGRKKKKKKKKKEERQLPKDDAAAPSDAALGKDEEGGGGDGVDDARSEDDSLTEVETPPNSKRDAGAEVEVEVEVDDSGAESDGNEPPSPADIIGDGGNGNTPVREGEEEEEEAMTVGVSAAGCSVEDAGAAAENDRGSDGGRIDPLSAAGGSSSPVGAAGGVTVDDSAADGVDPSGNVARITLGVEGGPAVPTTAGRSAVPREGEDALPSGEDSDLDSGSSPPLNNPHSSGPRPRPRRVLSLVKHWEDFGSTEEADNEHDGGEGGTILSPTEEIGASKPRVLAEGNHRVSFEMNIVDEAGEDVSKGVGDSDDDDGEAPSGANGDGMASPSKVRSSTVATGQFGRKERDEDGDSDGDGDGGDDDGDDDEHSTGSETSIDLDDINQYEESLRRAPLNLGSLIGTRAFTVLVKRERFVDWAGSLRRLDPRHKILTFFDDVARDGGVQKGISYRTVSNFLRSSDDSDGKGGGQLKRDAFVINEDSEGSWGRGLHDNSGELWKDSSSSLADLDSRHRNRRQRHPEHHQSGSQTSDVEMNSAVMNPQLQSPLLRFFNRAAVFTVWRPCSPDAIRAMMTGVATGKGLDVKGKSAKRGELSGYVPFVQIHDEDDKRSVGYVPDGVRMRCFYGREVDRDRAVEHLMKFAADCVRRDEEHEREVDDDDKESRKDWLSDGSVVKIDKYAPSTPALGARLLVGSLSSDDADISDGEAKVEYGDNNNVAVRISKIAKHSSKKGSSKDMPSTKEPCWGLECLQSLFWEGIVRSRPVGRPAGSDLDTGRPSEPAFQDMNLRTVRIAPASSSAPASASASSSSRGEPAVTHTTVVWQPEEAGNRDPLDPRTLLVAYEERGRVLPVVSDFDCFIVGTRGVPYDRPLPMEQVGLLNWSVDRVGGILDAQAERRREREERKQRRQQEGQNSAKRHSEQLPVTTEETEPNPKPEPEPEPEPEEPEPSWTSLWLDVLKRASSEPKSSPSHVPIPRFGYGDGTSYSMMGRAVERLECGAVRHGAECFNYKFPQEIDHQFLVVSDTLPGPVPWKYVSEPELRELLAKKANEGFSFPLNPKWVLCDPGWKDVYDKLINSEDLNVKRSMATWFPPVSGVRRRIEEVCERHPRGFLRDETAGAGRAGGGRNTLDVDDSGTEAMDLAELQLGRYLALQRAKRKLRTVLLLRRIGMEASVHRSDQNEGGGIDDRDGDKDGDRHRATEEENETAEADEVVTEIRSGSASFASVNARVCT